MKGPLSLQGFGQTQQASGLCYPVFTSPNFVPAEVSCRTSLFPQVQEGRNEEKHSVSPNCQSGGGTLLTRVPCVSRDMGTPKAVICPKGSSWSVAMGWECGRSLGATTGPRWQTRGPRGPQKWAQIQTHFWGPGGLNKGAEDGPDSRWPR